MVRKMLHTIILKTVDPYDINQMCYYYLYICRYVDVILQLIDKAGDFVSDDIWYRVVQFVTNNEDLQVLVLNLTSFFY